MTLKINKDLKNNDELFKYFKYRSKECCVAVESKYGHSQFKKCSNAINVKINDVSNQLRSNIMQVAQKEKWDNRCILETLLSVQYATSLSLLESRNSFFPYNYMDFSRRIGELWEKFCSLCFEYPCNTIQLFTPPLFKELKQFMSSEFEEYIKQLPISEDQRSDLLEYYSRVWKIVVSGDINLQLDCHFSDDNFKYNVDFKSGFGSNEKGNTNRLLLVGTLYSFFQENYKCILLVRSSEDENNNYFQTLKKSKVWEAYCSKEAYLKIHEFTGFDINSWFQMNVCWQRDLSPNFISQLQAQNIEKYLQW